MKRFIDAELPNREFCAEAKGIEVSLTLSRFEEDQNLFASIRGKFTDL